MAMTLLMVLCTAFAAASALPARPSTYETYRYPLQNQMYGYPYATFQQDVFEDGQTYVFLAQNERYLSRINRGTGYNPIEAEKATADVYCRFRASVLSNGKVAFTADNGKYLSRINRGSGLDPIEAAKDAADVYSQFEVEADTTCNLNGVRPVYMKADNGKYVSYILRNGIRTIEAAKSVKDVFSRFVVLKV